MSKPAKQIDRDGLLAAFDDLGAAAIANGRTLEIAVYGGSALMLASNFRYASEDVDIAEIERPWPDWLAARVATIAARNGWSSDWLNEAVSVHLSALADADRDHVHFGTFPRNASGGGLKVYVPTAEYLLALKLKATRVVDPAKGPQETADILNLAKTLGLTTPDQALAVLAKYFPRSGADADKQRFLLKHIWHERSHDAPAYARKNR
jgi:hypothetical protein